MSPNAIARNHYRAPTTSVYAQCSLDEFSREQIRAHLAHLDGVALEDELKEGALSFTSVELDRLYTLVLCGQRESAREWVCEQISNRIGRKL